jgi:CheY-like chemotaxis protein
MEHLRVLLVDDDEDFLTLWRMLLEGDPRIAEVVVAADGAEALGAATSAEIDVVLADAWMPTSGYELAERLRRERPDLPVVVTSCAYGAEEEALRRGAAAFIDKPTTVSGALADLLCAAVATTRRGAEEVAGIAAG